jgi:hypothetical protein
MGQKHDINDVYREEGAVAVRARHDNAITLNPDGRRTETNGKGAKHHPDIEFAEDTQLAKTNDDVVKGLVPAKSLVILYGPSAAGKTFLAIHLAFCIALGKRFFGRRIRQGCVLYIALEGQGGFAKRIVAARNEYGNPGRSFAQLKKSIVLARNKANNTDIASIIEAGKYVALEAGCPLALIIVDTYARAVAGDDEKEAACFAAVAKHANDIANQTGATVMLLHHPGKDAAKGPRGSSAITPGADAVIVIERDSKASTRRVELEKVKDGEEGTLGEFTLKTLVLGEDEEGNKVTSCIVQPLEGITAKGPRRPRPESQAGKALNELDHLLIDGKGKASRGHPRAPVGVTLIKRTEWHSACLEKRLTADGKEKSEDRAFQRAVKALVKAGLVGEYGEVVWATKDFVAGTPLRHAV